MLFLCTMVNRRKARKNRFPDKLQCNFNPCRFWKTLNLILPKKNGKSSIVDEKELTEHMDKIANANRHEIESEFVPELTPRGIETFKFALRNEKKKVSKAIKKLH